jgi:hypothetical protein
VAAFTAAAAEEEPQRIRILLQQGCAVAIAGQWDTPDSDAGDALKLFPLSGDTPSAWNAFLDELVLAFGGLDLLVTGRHERHFAEQSAELLALSPVGGRAERVGAPPCAAAG